jgi:hypothetical protein
MSSVIQVTAIIEEQMDSDQPDDDYDDNNIHRYCIYTTALMFCVWF